MSQSHHTCPKPNHGMLPFIILDAAIKGRESQVISWLEKGGDINASDMSDRTLVFLACEHNHLDILKRLLIHPEVHLNQETCIKEDSYFMIPQNLPLAMAISKGHVHCAEALITSMSLCQVDSNKIFRGNTVFITRLASQNQWQLVDVLLKFGLILKNSGCKLLEMALKRHELDIARDILKQDIFLRPQLSLYTFQELYNSNVWDEFGIDALFKKELLKNNDFSKRVLYTVLEKKDWKMLESLLKIVNELVKINIDLAEAVMGKNTRAVSELLAQEKLEGEVMNGTLLVASIGGTTEDIGGLLLDQKYDYSAQVLGESLILSCLNRRAELLPGLFLRGTFNFTTLHRAWEVCGHLYGSKLIHRAMERATKDRINPLERDSANRKADLGSHMDGSN